MAPEQPVSKSVAAPAEAASSAPPEEHVSRAGMLELFGQDENLLRELAGLFLEDGTALLHELRTAIAGLDAAKVDRAAHTLKGSVGNFGAMRAFELCGRLEAMGRSHDLGGAPEVLAALEQEMSRVVGLLTEITRENSE